jgi:hypothetical protein
VTAVDTAIPTTARGRLGRAAAAVALATAAVHVALLQDSCSDHALVMAAMALACLPCAWHLWRSPVPRVWAVTAGLDAVMAVLHLRMLSASWAAEMPADMAGMHMQPGAAAAASSVGGLMRLALALVASQLAIAAVAALNRYVPNRKCTVHASAPAVTQS